MKTIVVCLLVFVAVAWASGSGCSGSPKTFKNKPCASTSSYVAKHEGRCGCGNYWTDTPYKWVKNKLTAAVSGDLFSPKPGFLGVGWASCGGDACGICYKLTPVCPNCSPSSVVGKGAPDMTPITVMITDMCTPTDNPDWCPYPSFKNAFKYATHFTIMNNDAFKSFGWDNAEVTYEEVSCGDEPGTPTWDDRSTCEC